jgi:hypothetical protein
MKISSAIADGKKKRTHVLVTNDHNGGVAVVQEFEANLWVED